MHIYSKVAIRDFAAGAGVTPGIVVGRLQHERLLPLSRCNGLKRRYLFRVAASDRNLPADGASHA
jgi:hypothetical protein